MNKRLSEDQRPLILLIFANDHKSYLDGVAEERQSLLDLLHSKKISKLNYQVKTLDYTTLENVLRELSNNENRLFFIHFAGHSETDFLQFDQGKAYADGLANRLQRCPKLKVVFFNGCNNISLVKALKKVEIPYVIGTRKPIGDKAAKIFSKAFYESLIKHDQTIQNAFQSGTSALQITTNKQYRSLDIDTYDEASDWAWISEFNEPEWSFDEAADDCNRLPELSPETYPLPNEPFKGLHSYAESDAAIFFGRSSDTLSILKALDEPEEIFVLQGRSGAGKTSFVTAGLVPYLKQSGNSIHFIDSKASTDISSVRNCDILIVDHAENILLTDNQDLELLMRSGCRKIILSIRTEWFGELNDQLSEKYKQAFNTYLLKPLSRLQLIEIFKSVENLKDTKYRIEVNNPEYGNLSEIIINDLMTDTDSAIAPMLQILLKNMYDYIKDNESRIFDLVLYSRFKERGLGVISQIKEKLLNIRGKKNGESYYESGLLIDILCLYSTEYNTSNLIKKAFFERKYKHISGANEALRYLEDEHLVMTFYNESEKEFYTKLTHDSLSKYVHIIYGESSHPGQIARREINHVKRTWSKDGANIFEGDNIDAIKLSSVLSGLNGTYDIRFDPIEEKLIGKSKAQARKNGNIKIAVISLLIIIIIPVIYLVANYTELATESKLDTEFGNYLSLKAKFKNNTQRSDALIISDHYKVIERLNSLADEDLKVPANISRKYEILQDIYLILAVINYRSKDKDKGAVNDFAMTSETNGKISLELIETISPTLTKRRDDILFNLLYAKSMHICTGRNDISSVISLYKKINNTHLENTKNQRIDTCLVETLTKIKEIE